MKESGEISKHERELWIISSFVDDEEYFVFSMAHLLVAFYALSIGHSLGFVMYLLDLLIHSYSTNRQRTLRRKTTERLP
jgi:hypothetical protein